MHVLPELHQYVLFYGDDDERVYGRQGVVGDQLSVERGVNGHCSLANGFTPEERLEGLHFEIADWHGGHNFTEVGRYHYCMNFNYNHVILRCFHGNYWLATDSRFHNKPFIVVSMWLGWKLEPYVFSSKCNQTTLHELA